MIEFKKTELSATFTDASGKAIKRIQEVRTDPVTLKKCRVTPSRALENERGTEMLHEPPETARIVPKPVSGETLPVDWDGRTGTGQVWAGSAPSTQR